MKKILGTSFYKETLTADAEVLNWYRMSPVECFAESKKLWKLVMVLTDADGQHDPEDLKKLIEWFLFAAIPVPFWAI